MGKDRRNDDRNRGGGGKDRRNDDRNRGGGGKDQEQKVWKRNSAMLPGTQGQRLWLDKDGKVAARDKDIPEWTTDYGMGGIRNRQATAHSAEKLNRYLERSGNSLRGGKGAPIVGYKEVNLERTNFGGVPFFGSEANGQDGELPGGKEFVPIYGARPERQRNRNRDRERNRPEPTTPSQDPTSGYESFGGSDAANEAINSGLFDVPARPTWGEDFLRDYTSRATGSSTIDTDSPLQTSTGSFGSLRDGYPSAGDWSPPRTDGSESWNITPGGTPEDNEELSRTFAASAAFRDRLNAMVMA